MPFFSRRRLQSMLIDLSFFLEDEKERDLTGRLNSKDVDQSVPAEMELALLWAIHKTGDLEIEPEWWASSNRPDAYSETLIPNQPTTIEIAAHSDGRISFKKAMHKVTVRVCEFISTLKRRVSTYLYFHFFEDSGYGDAGYHRKVLATDDYILSESTKQLLKEWIESDAYLNQSLQILDGEVAFRVEKREYKHSHHHNFHTTMPPSTYSLKENPLYELLGRKLDQIAHAPSGTNRVIFIADAGSQLLSKIGGREWAGTYAKTGSEIVQKFVEQYQDRIDAVVIIAPKQELSNPLNGLVMEKDLSWRFTIFRSPFFFAELTGIETIKRVLPKPRLNGFQVRALAKQGTFSPRARGLYLSTVINWNLDKTMSIKISARLLLDFLAGKIDEEHFRHEVGPNYFKDQLDQGKTFVELGIELRELDKDDDYIYMNFSQDPSATPIQVEKSPGNK